jgi:hypothetical protein
MISVSTEKKSGNVAYQSTVFPAPATTKEAINLGVLFGQQGILTFTTNPQKGARRLPVDESITLNEPFRGPVVASFASYVVVLPWVWGGEPVLKISPHLVSCKTMSVFLVRNVKIMWILTLFFLRMARVTVYDRTRILLNSGDNS